MKNARAYQKHYRWSGVYFNFSLITQNLEENSSKYFLCLLFRYLLEKFCVTTFMTMYTCKNDVVSLKHHFLQLFSCNFFSTTLHNRAYLIIWNFFFFFFFSDRPTRFSGQEIRKPRNKKIVALLLHKCYFWINLTKYREHLWFRVFRLDFGNLYDMIHELIKCSYISVQSCLRLISIMTK